MKNVSVGRPYSKLKKPKKSPAKPKTAAERMSPSERLPAYLQEADPVDWGNHHRRRKAASKSKLKTKELGGTINLNDNGELRSQGLDGTIPFKPCDNVDQVADVLQKQANKLLENAAKAVPKERISQKVYDEFVAMTNTFGFCGDTNQTDGQLLDIGFRQIYKHTLNLLKNSTAAFVTIIDGNHSTSDFTTVVDLVGLKRSAHATLSAMSDNHLAFVETSLFNTHTHKEGGRILSWHTHALIWGDDKILDRARKVASKHAKRFEPNFSGAKPIHIQKCAIDEANLARVIGYMMKPAYRCQSFRPGNGVRKGNTHHSSKGDRHVKFLRLFQLRTLLTWDEMIFGKGEGNVIRREAIKHMKHVSKTQANTAGTVLHKDALSSWWSDLYVKLNLTRYKLPIIKTRH